VAAQRAWPVEAAARCAGPAGLQCEEQRPWSGGAMSMARGAAAQRAGPVGWRHVGPMTAAGAEVPCSSTHMCHSFLPFFSQVHGGQRRMAAGVVRRRVEGQRRMATDVVHHEWRDGVIPSFLHTTIGDAWACSSLMVLQMRDAKFEMHHLSMSQMTLWTGLQ
jgi:hypothetical protein